MKILVTGITGFLGGYLFENLARLLPGSQVWGAHRSGSFASPQALKVALDDAAAVKQLYRDHQFDAVVHMAASAHVKENALYGYFNNVNSGSYLIEGALASGVKRFLFASSCVVYGNQYSVTAANKAAQNPLEWYSYSKVVTENMLAHYAGQMESVILRVPSVSGQGRRNPVLFTDMIESLRDTGKIVVWGNGLARRQFLDVADFGRMVAHALTMPLAENPLTLPLVGREVVTILELAEMLVKLWGSGSVELLLEKPASPDKWVEPGFTERYFPFETTPLRTSMAEVVDSYKKVML